MIQVRPVFNCDQSGAVLFLTSEQVKGNKLSGLIDDKVVLEEASRAFGAGLFEGKRGDLFPVLCDERLILLAGLGQEKDLTPSAFCVMARKVLLSAYLAKADGLEIVPHVDSPDMVKALIDACIIGVYRWKKYLTVPKDERTVPFEKKQVYIIAHERPEYSAAIATALNVNFARDLVNENADVVDSIYLEKVMRGLVKGKKNIVLEVLGRKELQAKKFGLLLAVNQGSNKEPRVLIASYQGAGKSDPYTAVVGKGLTFDSGGLNLKTTGHIETMRCDMSGAAAVLAALKTAIELKIKRNIIFACGVAENAIDANAYKPGDVVIGYAGKSVEIGNTDAEGRLVLADVLAYLVKNYQPDRIIDIATLTGAVVVALGRDYAGLVSNDDELANALLGSSKVTDDRVWRMPSYPELKDAIKSKIADIRNISNWNGAGGTITGAEFLRQFVGDTPWAHLDIAGTAFVDNDTRLYYGHGATGAGVRLLVHFFQQY